MIARHHEDQNMTEAEEVTEADDLDELIRHVDEALTREFGPNHQEILSRGVTLAAFEW